MKIAIIGSRDSRVDNIGDYVSKEDEIVSGGAKGIDSCAAEYARENGMKLTEFFPKYELYGRAAPMIRNKELVDYADKVLAFWNGRSNGTRFVIKYAKKSGKLWRIIKCD